MKLEDRVKCSKEGCTKETYNTQEEARAELERILDTKRRLTEIKPCRFYECKCGKFALTSSPKITTY